MIELGRICLQHRTSVYDTRAKIRGLASAVGFDSIETTRLATAASEAVRTLRREGRDPFIVVWLATDNSPTQLVLDFECRGQTPPLGQLAGFFNCMSERESREGFRCVRARKILPDVAFEASSDFMAATKRSVSSRGRATIRRQLQSEPILFPQCRIRHPCSVSSLRRNSSPFALEGRRQNTKFA